MRSQELFGIFAAQLMRASDRAPLMVMMAGPNGAGKSTAWNTLLKVLPHEEEWEFLNGDEVVRDLVDAHYGVNTPLHAVPPDELKKLQKEAQGLMHGERRLRIQANTPENFAFETVFSDPDGHRLAELQAAADKGFVTVLVAVCCDDIETLIERVRLRADRGEHGVEVQTQRERYPRVRANLCRAASRVGLAILFDNSRPTEVQGLGRYRTVAVIENGKLLACGRDMPQWARDVVASIAPDAGLAH